MADFTETPTFVTTISGVDDGDPVNAAETNNAPQQLTNRTAYLKAVQDQVVSLVGLSRFVITPEIFNGPASDQTITGTWEDVISDTIALQAGDYLLVYCSTIAAATLATNGYLFARWRIRASSSSQAETSLLATDHQFTIETNDTIQYRTSFSLIGFHLASFSETYTVKVQGQRDSGSGNLFIPQSNMRQVLLPLRAYSI